MKPPKRYENSTFENWIPETESDSRLLTELKNGIKRNIILIGGVGTGKTHLGWAYVKTNPDTMFISSKDLIGAIREMWSQKNRDVYDWNPITEAQTAPVLIIDEVGVQYGTDSERIELYDIFNYRYENELPTMIISNNEPNELMRILGLRIWDRLLTDGKIYNIIGDSKRHKL